MTPCSRYKASGFTLLEVVIAAAIMAVLVLGIIGSAQGEMRSLSSGAQLAFSAAKAQDALRHIEQDLQHAQTSVPSALLVQNLGAGGNVVSVDSTAPFPNQGVLLLGRGTAAEERIQYTSFNAGLGQLDGLTRGFQCTTAGGHTAGDNVLWAGSAAAIALQVNPPANLWDGVSSELVGPVFYEGDGSGFSYQIPTDPAGGTNYFQAGQVTWGATVQGVPTLNGRSALYFSPVRVLSEAAAGADYNRDGDMADTFDLGSLRRVSWDSSNAALGVTDVGFCPPIVLQEQCNWGADLDNDGFGDPIFLWNEAQRTLHVTLLVFAPSPQNPGRTLRYETVIFIGNGSQS